LGFSSLTAAAKNSMLANATAGLVVLVVLKARLALAPVAVLFAAGKKFEWKLAFTITSEQAFRPTRRTSKAAALIRPESSARAAT
jgi:hypothetical protein